MSIIKLAPYLHEKLNNNGSNALDELKLYNETVKNDINNGPKLRDFQACPSFL